MSSSVSLLEKTPMISARDFCYWLRGYLEVADPTEIGPAQTETMLTVSQM